MREKKEERKSGMAFLKVLSCSLIFISSVVSSVDEFAALLKLRPEANLFTDHYDIKFILYPDGDIFYGEYNVRGYIPYETQNIYVYTENLSITGVKIVNDAEISKENGEIFIHRPNKITYDTKTYITTISFPFNLSGVYTLNVKYTGLLGDDGGFRTFYINNYEDQQNNTVWLAATHYDRFATRRLFPLLKSTSTTHVSYKISIKHHKNYTALSNMPELAVNNMKADENNMIWTHFKTTPSMYHYLIVAVVVDLFYITAETNQGTRLWCRKDMLSSLEFAYSVANNITLFLDRQWPSTRRTPKINHVVIPTLLNEKEIMLGFVLHREADIIYNEKTDHEGRKIEIIRSIGFKVAHEWFNNIIFPYMWEDNPWLRESFAMIFGIYAVYMSFPHFRTQDFFEVQMQHELLHWYTRDGAWPLSLGFHKSTKIPRYIKTSIVFRSLVNILSEEALWNEMHMYLRNSSYEINDFRIPMHTTIDISLLFKIKDNIETKMANWEQLKYYPVVKVERNYNASNLHISIENINTNIWIPVSITTHSNSNQILRTLWLDTLQFPNDTLYITFENENDWVLINLQQSGCYRVNYDVENWNRLSKYLNSIFFGNINVFDRAKIIDDTFHFLMTGQLDSTIFSNILHYLGQDTDYIAWYPVFKNLEYISGYLIFPESEPIKEKTMRPLIEIMQKIKYLDYKPGSSYSEFDVDIGIKFLREEAVRWLCIMGDNYCLKKANNQLRWYLDNEDNEDFLPKIYQEWTGFKEWVFCNGLKTADNETWTKTFNIYWKKSDNSILKFLTCSQNVDSIEKLALHMYRAIHFNFVTFLDYINNFISIIVRHTRNNLIFDSILKNLQLRRLPVVREFSAAATLTIIINNIISREQFKKIEEYAEANFKGSSMPTLIRHSVPPSIPLYLLDPSDERLIYKEYTEKYPENLIICVKRKLQLRWNQIRTQLKELQYLSDKV